MEPSGAPEFPQTDLELLEGAEGRADEKAGSQTGSEASGDEAAGESGPTAAQTDSGQPKSRLRMPGRRGQRVVSIDAERTVETDTDKLRSDLLDLVESLKGKKIMTGTIQGVERLGSLHVGTVSMVDTTGVFVSLDGGIDCLCTYPKRGRPPRGCRVSVRILGINYESNRIWGVITHMSTVR